MPRSINLETLEWAKNTPYGDNELGAGTVVREDSGIIGAFLHSDAGYDAARQNLGRFEWHMADEYADKKTDNKPGKEQQGAKPSSALNDKADEIFEWVSENLSGKWFLHERFAYRFSQAYAFYLIEDEADRKKFQKKWGDVFTFEGPTAKNPKPVLTEFEAAHQASVQSHLKEVWKSSNRILPLYKGDPEGWFFLAARIEGKDRLFIIPEEQREAVEKKYGVKMDKNPVTHLASILEGKTDFEAGPDFREMVHKMLSGFGRDTFAAREVDGYRFGLTASTEGEKKVKSYHDKETTLEEFREAYKQGQDLRFYMGYDGESFTYNVNKPLVAYREAVNGGTAVQDFRGSFVHANTFDGVTGQFNKATGRAEGEWERVSNYDGPRPGNKKQNATYKNGRLITGTLQIGSSDDSHYQPAKPKLAVLG